MRMNSLASILALSKKSAPLAGGNSQKAVQRYMEDMAESFSNVISALKPKSRLVVIGDYRRNLYEEIGRRLGVMTEYRLQRHVNRRTGRRGTDFFEDVIVWRT